MLYNQQNLLYGLLYFVMFEFYSVGYHSIEYDYEYEYDSVMIRTLFKFNSIYFLKFMQTIQSHWKKDLH